MTEPNITYTAQPPSTSLSNDTLFHILENKRRRIVIQQLHASEESQVSARDLAKAVASEEDTGERSCYISLIQNHLQKLDEVGVVKYDHDSKTAAKASEFTLAALAWFVAHANAATDAA